MSALLIMLAVFLGSFLLSAFALWGTAKLFKFTRSTLPRAFAATALMVLLNLLLTSLALAIPADFRLPCSILAFLLQLALSAFIIKKILRTTTGKSFAGLGSILLAQAAVVVVALTVVRPFLVEAYSIPTESMAPTLRGPHYVGKCPHCGGELLIDAPDPRLRYRPQNEEQHAICAACRQNSLVKTADITGPIIPSDRILVSKFLTPERWDLIVYRAAPTGDFFTKRLVALPGETIAINDAGQISINGKPIAAPPDQPTLTFPWPDDPMPGIHHALTPTSSLHLGPDEFFAVGDNARESYDSRFLGPVKRSDIIGVATMIYFPLSRIKIVR